MFHSFYKTQQQETIGGLVIARVFSFFLSFLTKCRLVFEAQNSLIIWDVQTEIKYSQLVSKSGQDVQMLYMKYMQYFVTYVSNYMITVLI